MTANSKEENYEMVLVVKVKGHGTHEHKRKQAATIKRILEVKTHSTPTVYLVEDDGEDVLTLTMTEVTWNEQKGMAGE